MLKDVKLIRRHSKKCKDQQHLGEDVLTAKGCDCNFGYKGSDPTTGRFRRLQFIPAIGGEGPLAENAARQKLFDMQRGVVPATIKVPTRITIEDAFEKYLAIIRKERHVKESSIYAMFRPVGNMMVREAVKLGVKFMDELTTEFATIMIATFGISRREERMTPEQKEEKKPKGISINVQGQYRMYFEDFCRVARKLEWTALNLCEKLEPPNRGKARTKAPHPTLPFNLTHEFPKILDAIRRLDLGKSRTRRSLWKDNVETAIAFLLTLRHGGMRLGDSLMFDPRLLEPTTINGQILYTANVKQEKTGDNSLTPMVRIYIPKEDGDFIMKAPRFSQNYAFIPAGVKDTFGTWRSWKNNTYKGIFMPLAALSGVRHVHAHRFRDTFAREIWMKLKGNGGVAAITYLSKRLGHSSVKVTMEHYMQWLDEDQSEADMKFFGHGS